MAANLLNGCNAGLDLLAVRGGKLDAVDGAGGHDGIIELRNRRGDF
jgi:hypothetical protein